MILKCLVHVCLCIYVYFCSEAWKNQVPCRRPAGQHRSLCMGSETLQQVHVIQGAVLHCLYSLVKYQPGEDWVFAPVKWLAGKIASEMTYNVSSGTLNTTLSLFIHSIAFVEHIVALLPWCSSVCPSVCLGRACIVIIMVHFSADLSSLLDSPMFWAPWRQSMSTYSQPSFSSSTWNRSGVWMCKIGKALFTQILINK